MNSGFGLNILCCLLKLVCAQVSLLLLKSEASLYE